MQVQTQPQMQMQTRTLMRRQEPLKPGTKMEIAKDGGRQAPMKSLTQLNLASHSCVKAFAQAKFANYIGVHITSPNLHMTEVLTYLCHILHDHRISSLQETSAPTSQNVDPSQARLHLDLGHSLPRHCLHQILSRRIT